MTVTHFYTNGQYYEVSGLGYTPEGEIRSLSDTEQEPSYSAFIAGALLCNESALKEVEGKFVPFGNPTEIALTVLGQKAGRTKTQLLESHELIRTLPFTSDRKTMSIIEQKKGDNYLLYIKGAPDVLVEKSRALLIDGELNTEESEKQKFITTVNDYANEALRTLAVGYRLLSKEEAEQGQLEDLEKDIILTGVAGIIDPAREEVKASVKTLQDASVEVVMITGDHENTARAIAYKLGIVKSKEAKVIKGIEIEEMTDEELYAVVKTTNVYARVFPEHKQRIVKQLQKHGKLCR